MLFTPVVAGVWRHSELLDDTFTLADLLDIVEVLEVKAENEKRFQEQLDREAELNRLQNNIR